MSQQTPLQRKAVDAIMGVMEHYLEMRHQQVIRINPGAELCWEDICWQEMTRLRKTISMDKAYGPVRHHLAQLLLSDDRRKVNDLLQPKGQYSLLGEIVEEREALGKKTEGQLEVHDMRTLFRAIDPQTETIITLIQTYIWWDLPDAIIISRFDWKADRIEGFLQKGITDEMAAYYMELMGGEKKPSTDDVINYECRMLERTVNELRIREDEERGFSVIVRRDPTANDDPDRMIEVLAHQMGLLKNLEQGGELDDTLREKFARAMKVEAGQITPDKAADFLEDTIATNKKRLRDALNGKGSGELHNYKLRQLGELERRLKEIVGDRQYQKGDAPVADRPSSG